MSIGAKGRDILAQFLIESILISVTGGLIGVVFGIGAAVVVNLAAAFPHLHPAVERPPLVRRLHADGRLLRVVPRAEGGDARPDRGDPL